ncbi:hypothetical protein A2693_00055 [Candidatus Curtissbacteria bacterium RIFCSPHIGHO2_01_FULL_40_12]|uniref:Glycosyl transferase family 1 domain-containing protein n=1 Tax=Candidatus Curtissbacteria bacterium RIFCSPHIGHO2_01_FULL_40_12 TaxID=1797710 RepID=A0A1F5GB06_9BACT|nr:MAG: hypothetical protein A2693_00055 [Candidatus Curtissbacteria bacterium RIFCSPHIGHO2_01_FULL_40_12]
MRIALVRGPSLNDWELQNWLPLAKRHQLLLVGSTSTKLFTSEATLAWSICVGELISKIPLGYFLITSLFGDPRMIWNLESLIKGYDVAVTAETRSYYSLQAIRAKQKGFIGKVAVTVWENIPFLGDGHPRTRRSKEIVKEEADLFLAVTHQAKKALIKEGVNPKKVTVVPMGVDQSKFKVKSSLSTRNSLKASKLKVKDKINILSVGRLVPEKGFDDLLRACEILAKDKSLKEWFHLTIVGEGPQEEKLREMAGYGRLPGLVSFKKVSYDQMPKVYRSADIFVLASKPTSTWQEQYGMVLAEVASCGLAIVASKSGSNVLVTEKAAVYFYPGNFRQLYFLLIKLIVDEKLRKKKRLEAKMLAVRKFNANRVAEILESNLRDLVANYL